VEAPANTTDLSLNQYWYSPATIATLVAEIQSHVTAGTSDQQGVRVGFLSTPSLYFELTDIEVQRRSTLFEFDERWSQDARAIGGQGAFRFFDYNELQPLEQWRGSFDLLVIDPPYIDRKVWRAYIAAASLLLSNAGELLLTTVAEREEELTQLVSKMPQASGRRTGWGLRRHAFEPINQGCAHRFCVFSTWRDSPQLDAVNPEPLPACSDIDGLDEEEDLLALGGIGRDAMLAISCESDSEEDEKAGVRANLFEPPVALHPEPEPEPEEIQWWQRNDRPFSERFVKSLQVPWNPQPEVQVSQKQQSLSLMQSEGAGPDSDGQVTVWDAAIVLHRMLLCCAAARKCCGSRKALQRQGVIELGAGSGLVGITAARLGATVCLTDLGAVLPTLRENVRINCGIQDDHGGSAMVTELFWGKDLPDDVTKFVHGCCAEECDGRLWILASDVVYLVQILPELAHTINALCDAAEVGGAAGVTVVLVSERRWDDIDAWFLEALEKHFLYEALVR
jgi:16S rRNA G966 N2-methylase RsmD